VTRNCGSAAARFFLGFFLPLTKSKMFVFLLIHPRELFHNRRIPGSLIVELFLLTKTGKKR